MNDHPGYLFSINTGRSGSEYLTRIFEHVEGCRSFHEPRESLDKRSLTGGCEQEEFLWP